MSTAQLAVREARDVYWLPRSVLNTTPRHSLVRRGFRSASRSAFQRTSEETFMCDAIETPMLTSSKVIARVQDERQVEDILAGF